VPRLIVGIKASAFVPTPYLFTKAPGGARFNRSIKEQMTRKQSLIFRIILFLLGAGIIISIFFQITGGKELSRIDAFIWISIAVMYLVVFTPLFFSTIRTATFPARLPSLAIVWTGIIGYIGLSILNIFLLLIAVISFNIALTIQAVILFLFLILVYFSYFVSGHIGSVAAQEAAKKHYVNQLKSKSQVLLISVNGLPAEYEAVQTLLKRSIEDMKYIYPVDNGAGDELELRIIAALRSIAEMCDTAAAGGSPSSLESSARNLQALVKERKLLRN
jgi:hypothetical protein